MTSAEQATVRRVAMTRSLKALRAAVAEVFKLDGEFSSLAQTVRTETSKWSFIVFEFFCPSLASQAVARRVLQLDVTVLAALACRRLGLSSNYSWKKSAKAILART